MSEELKQKAREFLKAHQYDDESDFVAEDMADFAAQVCEQREKEHDEALMKVRIAEDAFQMDEALKIETPIGEMNALEIRTKMHDFQVRAEAAELALQTLKEDVAKADKAAVKAMKLVEAQARQQAIADTVEQCASIATVAANAMGQKPAIARVEALRIADRIRSLTPPPALTKEK